ncbi:MAG: hypothetical protein WD097_09325 [Balneolales bacterium]
MNSKIAHIVPLTVEEYKMAIRLREKLSSRNAGMIARAKHGEKIRI